MSRGVPLLKHPKIDEILAAIDEGMSQKEISIRYEIERTALNKLLKNMKLREHPDTEKAVEALRDMEMNPPEISENLPSHRVYGGVDIREEMLSMLNSAERVRAKAESAGNLQQANTALREKMRIIDSMAKMSERMRKSSEFNPWTHPEVISYQEGMLHILRKHPKALEDVIEYIERFGSRPTGSDQEGEG